MAETRGNPLVLSNLPRGLAVAELAGHVEDSFRRQIEALPTPTWRLLLLAAADAAEPAGRRRDVAG